ncbi:16S rRNA (guanine(527)-N(7))-methyltransferase RsmG [Azoarcus indigens]|uniref:Ribosomal RNA small subunit methyltransferase G n=1 Tax=Azoarcus indigens TaxID=29545 RepID=A0A4R6DPN5_9RHOO|nr:16S rRNA (guanine(527)-N(7))-methyltransferase RsmG [Azoarcus indigens]NMG66006.1 16S rRNA (guanine(527)-N(7))-methyltransferase RsmG [Azoarcus indigens]TDN46897.1 16S rRNA m(7)G-527 methyltransferase [Azoarcus indigens]
MSALAPYAGQLAEGLAALGLEVAEATRARLLAYGELLLKWNRVYNLTAIRRPQEVVTHHLLDSLAVAPWLDKVQRLADIGSGGGLPGIPLAILRPELAVSSVETVNKKASFQQQAKIELGLGNFQPINARVENLQPELPFDGVISRAFSSLGDFVQLAGHLVAEGGALYAMKGLRPDEELGALPAGWTLQAMHALAVPGLDAERHLLVLVRM